MGGGVSTQSALVVSKLSKSTTLEAKELNEIHGKLKEVAAKQGNPTTITFVEFEEALAMIGTNNKDRAMLSVLFQHYDQDGTGDIDFVNYLACCAPLISGDVADQLQFSLGLFDAAGTGAVSRCDLKAVLAAVNLTASWFGDAPLAPGEVDTVLEDAFQGIEVGEGLKHEACLQLVSSHPLIAAFLKGQGGGGSGPAAMECPLSPGGTTATVMKVSVSSMESLSSEAADSAAWMNGMNDLMPTSPTWNASGAKKGFEKVGNEPAVKMDQAALGILEGMLFSPQGGKVFKGVIALEGAPDDEVSFPALALWLYTSKDGRWTVGNFASMEAKVSGHTPANDPVDGVYAYSVGTTAGAPWEATDWVELKGSDGYSSTVLKASQVSQ